MHQILEIPLVSATVLDASFTTGVPALRKYRQTLRETLDPGMRFSLGRAGTVQLGSVATLDCVATAARWRAGDADVLAEAYLDAGFHRLVQSDRYAKALHLVRQEVQTQARGQAGGLSPANTGALVARCVAGLTATQPAVRGIAVAMGRIMKKVDDRLDQMKRLPGRIVRGDGPETLVVVHTGEREELRSFQSDYLQSLGLREPGAPFVLHEFSWTPETRMSVFFPALDLAEAEGAELEEQLQAAEQPLPYPAPQKP